MSPVMSFAMAPARFWVTCLAWQFWTCQACSNFAMQNSFGLSVRTMDLGNIPGLSWTILTEPSRDSSKHSLTGFAATLGGVPIENWIMAGPCAKLVRNDAGLSCDAQTLIGTKYPAPSTASGAVDALHLCRWALERFSTLEELKEGLGNVTFSGPHLAEKNFLGGLHWVLRDAERGLVLEFVEGKLMTYEDDNDGQNGFGIMTNEPAYPWHIQAVKHLQWKESLARSAVSMPGSWYPDERFQRIFLVKRGMPKPNTYQEAVMQAVHVLNTVTVPMGLQMGTDSGKHSGEGSADHTQWGVIYDHLQGILYWRSVENQNLQRASTASQGARGNSINIQLLQLKNLWASGQKRSMNANAAQLPWFQDVTPSSSSLEEVV